MGWWSTEVLGGDSPLDWSNDLKKAIGVDSAYSTFDPREASKEDFLKGVLKYVSSIEEILKEHEDKEKWRQDWAEDFCRIGYQVLAHYAVEAGIKLGEEVSSSILESLQNDEWAKENEDRKEKLAELEEKFKNLQSS